MHKKEKAGRQGEGVFRSWCAGKDMMKRTKVRKTPRRSKHKLTGPLGVNKRAKSMPVANWVTGKWCVSGHRPQV